MPQGKAALHLHAFQLNPIDIRLFTIDRVLHVFNPSCITV